MTHPPLFSTGSKRNADYDTLLNVQESQWAPGPKVLARWPGGPIWLTVTALLQTGTSAHGQQVEGAWAGHSGLDMGGSTPPAPKESFWIQPRLVWLS